jgi:transposase
MRYDLTDFEWSVIEPVLPKGRPGPLRKDDRRVMNGIFWVLRTGAPWRDLPEQSVKPLSAHTAPNKLSVTPITGSILTWIPPANQLS